MGDLSARHFSNYPPLNQILFALAALIGGKSIIQTVIVLRAIVLLADIGIILLGERILRMVHLPAHSIFLYFLNPLVIVELAGNLHFEGVMLFFFALALYLLLKTKWQWAGVAYAAAISIKLVPLMFLPLFLSFFRWKRALAFYVVIGVASVLLFIPFYDAAFFGNYGKTIGLWFSNFEFNAGPYNLVKYLATTFYDAKPWELVKSYGKITPVLTIATVLVFTFYKKRKDIKALLRSMLWVLTVYFCLSTTVHPWYIVFLVFLASFGPYRFPMVWTTVIVLSYYAYAQSDFRENLGLLGIEYLVLFSIIAYEIVKYSTKSWDFIKNKNKAS